MPPTQTGMSTPSRATTAFVSGGSVPVVGVAPGAIGGAWLDRTGSVEPSRTRYSNCGASCEPTSMATRPSLRSEPTTQAIVPLTAQPAPVESDVCQRPPGNVYGTGVTACMVRHFAQTGSASGMNPLTVPCLRTWMSTSARSSA